jgi:hypothetical protein
MKNIGIEIILFLPGSISNEINDDLANFRSSLAIVLTQSKKIKSIQFPS